MNPATTINSLSDDLLIRILWHSQPAPQESLTDKLWNSITPDLKPFELPDADTPPDAYSLDRQEHETPIPTPGPFAVVALSLLNASICRRWRNLAKAHVSTLVVRENCTVSKEDLAVLVSRFPNLTHLHLSDGSVDRLDDDFLSGLGSSCPKLTTLHIGWGISRSRDRTKFEHPITPRGLDLLFQRCTGLQQLSIFLTHDDRDLPASFFQLKNLRTLFLSDPSALENPSFKNFTFLTTLYIGFPFHHRHLSTLAHLPDLTHLSIISSYHDGQDSSPSSILSSLKSLKFFQSCHPLDSILLPGSPCTRLEDLVISGCDQLHHLPDHLGELLPRLRRLIIRKCKSLVELPEDFISLTRLEIFVLECCSRIRSLPSNFGGLPALKMLAILAVPFKALPDSLCQLTSLQAFFLDIDPFGQNNFQLPDGFGELIRLQLLHIYDIRYFPPSFTRLSSLTELHLKYGNFSGLPEGMEGLQNLKVLRLRDCEKIELLPESLANLTRLESLRFQINSEIQGVGAVISLHEVPQDLESLGRLKDLELSAYRYLTDIPEYLPRSLEVLRVGSVITETDLPDLSQVPNLTDLTLDLPRLEDGVAMSRSLSQLRRLTLRLPDTATELPFPLTFPQLRSLTICAAGLERLPEGIGSMLPQLRELNVEWTESLDTMLASMSELRTLTALEIAADGADVSSVPVSVSSLPRLRKLCVYKSSGSELYPPLPYEP